MENPLDKYLREHSDRQSEALDWIVRQTHIRTNYPQMLSGPTQGALLRMIVSLSGAKRAMEIGSFTGYSSVCIASALPSDGHLDCLEINDELEDLILEGVERAGLSSKVTLHIGDACETLKTLNSSYDFIFMDANKREYLDYYHLVFDLLAPGGVIVADDVLWDGKVYAEKVPTDAQTRGIVEFNEYVAADDRVEKVLLPLRDGLYIIRKKYA